MSNPDTWKYTVQVPIITEDKETHEITTTWVEEQHFDFNRIEAATPNQWTGYAGNSETAQLKEDFTVTGTTLLGVSQSDNDGIVHMPDTLKEETLYYWIETATADGYTAELNVPHYFIVYQVYDDDGNLMDIMTQEVDSSGTALAEWQAKQWRGWALDDAAQYANDITVASLAAENTWTVNNQESEYTSISATKTWAGDYDNFYETRPKEGIQLKLIQISSDGTETQYGPIVPINVDDNGNWPTYVWQQLPKTGNNDVTYTYRVEEIPVSGYTTAYTVGGSEQPNEGIESGEITVTNTLIPTKTNISVKKVFDQAGTAYPDQILVYLYEITTNKETGVQTRAQRSSYALTAADGWAYTWRNLPTKDGDGNALTYTVVEGAVGDGFSYTVSYSDNGEGITGNTAEDPLVITNTENGLEITKTLGGDAARLMEDTETAAAMRALISFSVTDGTNQVSFTLADMTANEDGTYSFKLTSSTYPWLTPGKTVYVQETNETFTNTDLVSVSYAINGGDTVTVTENMETVTVNGYTVTGGLDTIDFTNEYHEDTVNLSVDKKWLNVEGVEQDREYWPEGMVVTFNLTADEGDGAIATGATKIMTAAGQTVTFEGLPKYVLNTETEIIYSVTETVDGYESSITSRVDEDGNVYVTVTNRKASPRLYVQKVWNGSTDLIPSNLTIDLYVSETEGATTGGTLVNTITITAADHWKGYFETDKEGKKLEEGKYYYIQERGAGGWTLSGYSNENGQAFVDMETITVTNTRDNPPPEKTSVAVQKKWTVNGKEADPEDWEPVQVQLVRYKAEAPMTTVKTYIYCWDDTPSVNRLVPLTELDAEIDADGNISIGYDTDLRFNGSIDWRAFESIDAIDQKWEAMDGPSIAKKSPISYSVGGQTAPIYFVAGSYNMMGSPTLTTIISNFKDLNAGSAAVDDLTYQYDQPIGTGVTLDSSNSWQYEFANLDIKSEDGAYLYAYTVVETDTSKQTNVTVTGGKTITLADESTVETGGIKVITNNKEYGSIEVDKITLKNGQPDTEAAGQLIKVGLFTAEQQTGSMATPTETKTIKLDENGRGSVTFDHLALGPYYVYELDSDNKVVLNSGTIAVAGKEYTVSEETSAVSLTVEKKTGTISITNSRTVEENGSLKITKIVTVNDAAPTPANAALTNGTYKFTVAGVENTATAGISHTVNITFANGNATKYQIDSENEVSVSGTDNKWTVEIPNLPAGNYIITENAPSNGTVLESASGGTSVNNSTKAVTVTVVAGSEVPTTAMASFTNNKEITNFEFYKKWINTNQQEIEWDQDIRVTVGRYKVGTTEDESFELVYSITKDAVVGASGETAEFSPSTGTDPKLKLTITTEGTTKKYHFKIEGLEKAGADGEYTYFVKETNVQLEGYMEPSYSSTRVPTGGEAAFDGGTIVNKQVGGYELPQTGGIGTTLFTALGGLMTVTAGAVLTLRTTASRCRGEKQAS